MNYTQNAGETFRLGADVMLFVVLLSLSLLMSCNQSTPTVRHQPRSPELGYGETAQLLKAIDEFSYAGRVDYFYGSHTFSGEYLGFMLRTTGLSKPEIEALQEELAAATEPILQRKHEELKERLREQLCN